MATLYQKRARELTPDQKKLKQEMDKQYEIDSAALANPFYQKKRSVGVTEQEEADYTAQYHALWDAYVEKALQLGLMEEIQDAGT
jgi:hypothetical protein